MHCENGTAVLLPSFPTGCGETGRCVQEKQLCLFHRRSNQRPNRPRYAEIMVLPNHAESMMPAER